MDRDTFIKLPIDEIAHRVQEAGTHTCVFPINGTRRWFMLEHMPKSLDNLWPTYMDITGKRHTELYRMVFEHGITHLLTPISGPDILERDEEYINQMLMPGMRRLVEHPDFLNFYDECEVRVRFYGDYRKHLKPDLADILDSVTERTRRHTRRYLYYGLFADDAAETLAQLAIKYHASHNKPPDKRTLIELYYGEPVPPVNLFIGFSKFASFDMPLVATGSEDLYFTVSPSLYLTEKSLRDILYDHLYSRRDDEEDFLSLSKADQDEMRVFYHDHADNVLGIGEKHERWKYWVPRPRATDSAKRNP